MLAEALTYGFVLLGKRPATVVGCLSAGLLLAVALDYTLAVTGILARFYATENSIQHTLFLGFYYLARALVTAIPSAIVLMAALKKLGAAEPSRHVTLADCLRVCFVTLAYTLLLVAPALIFQNLLQSALERTGLSLIASFAASVAALLLQIFLLAAFAFAWPHTLTTRRLVLFRSWPLMRPRYWTIAGVFTMALIIGSVVTWVGRYGGGFIYAGFAGVSQDTTNQFGPAWVLYSAATESGRILASYLLSVANVFLYAKFVSPPEPVAHLFD